MCDFNVNNSRIESITVSVIHVFVLRVLNFILEIYLLNILFTMSCCISGQTFLSTSFLNLEKVSKFRSNCAIVGHDKSVNHSAQSSTCSHQYNN